MADKDDEKPAMTDNVVTFVSQAEKTVRNAEEMFDELKASFARDSAGYLLHEHYYAHYLAMELLSKDFDFSHQLHMKEIYEKTNAAIKGSSFGKTFQSAINAYRQTQEALKRTRIAENKGKSRRFDEIPEGEWATFNDDHQPTPSFINAQLAFKYSGIKASFNLMSEKKTFMKDGRTMSGPEVRNMLYDDHGMDFPKRVLDEAMASFSMRYSHHPIIDWLDSLVGDDDVNLIDGWMTRVLGAEDNEINRQIGRKMLVAMVARVRKPGIKFDTMVVFESPLQGIGKSTMLEILCGGPEFFNTGKILAMEAKQQMEALKGTWIYESADLVGHSKADTDAIKAFLSTTHDKGRWAYAPEVTDHPRTALIVGTTNKTNYLIDETGDRRTWPVRCNVVSTDTYHEGKHTPMEVNLSWLRENRNQLFYEANKLFEAGESLVIPRALWPEISKLQSDRKADVPGIEFVDDIFAMNESEGFFVNTTSNIDAMDLRIFSKALMGTIFRATVQANTAQGRTIKAAMLAYRLEDYGKWEYKQVLRIKEFCSSGYIMEIKGKEACEYVLGYIKAHQKARKMRESSQPM